MPWKSRSLLLALLSVLYVLVAAMRASSGAAWGLLALLALPVGLLVVWDQSSPPSRGEDWVSPTTRAAMRATAFGAALMTAARIAPPDHATFEAIAVAGTTVAAVGSLVALSRIAPLGGLLVVPPQTRGIGAAIAVGIAGSLAVCLCFLHAWREPSEWTRPLYGPLALPIATWTVSAFALAVSILWAWTLRGLRRLDLGAYERLSAALTLSWAAVLIGIPASLLRVAPASQVLPVVTSAAAFGTCAACLTRDPTFVGRAQRVFVAVALLGGPAALFAASMASQIPREAGLITLLGAAAGVVAGLSGVPVARPLDPEQTRWIDAIKHAAVAATRAEPEIAVANALTTLRQAFGPEGRAPELWSIDPATLTTVDRAGYSRVLTSETAPPFLLFELAQGEPEQTLSTGVLESLEVRRADIRPALAWLRGRDAMSFTLLTDEQGAIGALVLPEGARTRPLTLEEVRELRILADRLGALLSLSSTLLRAQNREMVAKKTADQQEDRALYWEHLFSAGTERHEALTRRLARSSRIAAGSPAARLAIDELERSAQMGAHVSLLTPPGIDPVPYGALVHGSGQRHEGPFVVVDAADKEEQQPATWSDAQLSPLCLADGGTLMILSVSALPQEAQRFLAQSLTERRSPAGHAAPLTLSLVVSVPASIDVLVASGQLDAALADRLGDRAVLLPPLVSRAEDLRGLFVDRLARLGVRLRGRPMGIDARAVGRLIEHGWPGNEVELDDVLTRAATIAEGDVVTSAHLDAIGFEAAPPAARRSRPSGSPEKLIALKR